MLLLDKISSHHGEKLPRERQFEAIYLDMTKMQKG